MILIKIVRTQIFSPLISLLSAIHTTELHYTSLAPFSLPSSSTFSLPKRILNHSPSIAESKPEANSGSPLLVQFLLFLHVSYSQPLYSSLIRNLQNPIPAELIWEPFSYFEPAFLAHQVVQLKCSWVGGFQLVRNIQR